MSHQISIIHQFKFINPSVFGKHWSSVIKEKHLVVSLSSCARLELRSINRRPVIMENGSTMLS